MRCGGQQPDESASLTDAPSFVTETGSVFRAGRVMQVNSALNSNPIIFRTKNSEYALREGIV